MNRRNLARVCLGLQWDTATWNEAPSWWDLLLSRIEDARVLWNLSPLPSDSASRRRPGVPRELAERAGQARDAVSCRGFSGACHVILNVDELEKELSWGSRNPWGTGIADLLGLIPSAMAPRLPDLQREETLKLYASHGFRWIGIAGSRPPARLGELGLFSFSTVRVAPLKAGDPNLRRLRRMGGADTICMLDLSGLASADSLRLALDEISAAAPSQVGETAEPGAGGARRLIDQLASGAVAAEVPPLSRAPEPDWSSFPAPNLRASMRVCPSGARHRKKKHEEYRELLLSIGSATAAGPEGSAVQPTAKREMRLVAHMLGEVILAGRDFDVKLNGGRFHGLVRKGTDLTPPGPASSYLKLRGRSRSFRTVSSFSFDSDSGTGLREELKLEGFTEGSLSIEYGFRDDSPLLNITAEIHYPVLDPAGIVEEYSPLTLTLADGREPAWIDSAAPDGSKGRHLLAPGSGWVSAPCASLRARNPRGGWLTLRFPPGDGRGWGLPFLRLRRAMGRYLLEANPFGSYGPVPASTLSGRRERFILELGVER